MRSAVAGRGATPDAVQLRVRPIQGHDGYGQEQIER
jgi:hypothetical protein